MNQKIVFKKIRYYGATGELMVSTPYMASTDSNVLLDQILRMPKKNPLTLQEANELASKEVIKIFYSEDYIQILSFMDVWVQWVSDQGYHIELKGDEYQIIGRDH